MRVEPDSFWGSDYAADSEAEERLLRAVESVYGLGRCAVVRRIVTWGSNLRLQLCAADGANYFLKEKPFYLVNDEFDFHLRLQQHIHQQNGPVVAIRPTVRGHRSFCWNDRMFELQEWFDGEELDFRQEEYPRQLGSLIYRFLNAASDFKDKHEGDWSFPHCRGGLFPERYSEIENYSRHIDKKLSQLGEHNARAMSHIRTKITDYGASLASAAIPQQFIHGDPCDSNCLVSNSFCINNRRLVLIDLDCAHWGYRLSDVGMALAVLAGMKRQENLKYIAREEWDTQSIGDFLEGFNAESPLLSIETKHLSSFLGLNLVRAFVSCLELDDLQITPTPDLSHQLDMLANLLESLNCLSVT